MRDESGKHRLEQLWMTKNVRLRIYDVFIKELGNDQKDFDEESER